MASFLNVWGLRFHRHRHGEWAALGFGGVGFRRAVQEPVWGLCSSGVGTSKREVWGGAKQRPILGPISTLGLGPLMGCQAVFGVWVPSDWTQSGVQVGVSVGCGAPFSPLRCFPKVCKSRFGRLGEMSINDLGDLGT